MADVTTEEGMAFFNASTSASLTSDGTATEDLRIDSSARNKDRASVGLHRTFSSPSPSRSAICPSRSIHCHNGRDHFPTSRSLRSVSSPSRMSLFANRHNNYKFHSLLQNSSSRSFDFKFKRKQPKLISTNQNSSELDSQDNSIDALQMSRSNQILSLTRPPNARVGRSISSPECLHPQLTQCASNPIPCFSPSSPGRLSCAIQSRSQNFSNRRSATLSSAASMFPSPSVSYTGDFQNISMARSIQNVCSPAMTGISGSLDSSIYSSGTSIRGGLESDTFADPRMDLGVSYQGRHYHNTSLFNSEGSSLWPGEHTHPISQRIPGSSEERPRLSQLTLSHLNSRDLSSIHFQSPPPSYEKLCNPEALPTYQEALVGERKGLRKIPDPRMVFTLPSLPDYSTSHTDPLLQETERSFNGGILSSLAADLSDSEGSYTTIMDAIPSHPARESCPSVPIRFLAVFSRRRLRSFRCRSLCLSSQCNKSIVKKELNRRWPFIVGAVEDERCPGLLLIECSSNLTVAQLPDGPQSADDLTSGTHFFPSTAEGTVAEPPSSMRTDPAETPRPDFSAAAAILDRDFEEAAAFNNHVMFYLCGKCVAFDSFDADSVRTHIDYDCTGPANKWANISELYLVVRAFCFVLTIILLLMFLPLGGW